MKSGVAWLMLGMLFTCNAIADDGLKVSPPFCSWQTTLMHRMAMQDTFDEPPAINALIANAIDGKLPQVREQLSAMPAADASRWRQSALIAAAYAQKPALVEALLHDGAAVNDKGRLPGLKRGFHDQVVDEMKKNPGWETSPNLFPDADAVLTFEGGGDGPALFIAAQCGDVSTMNVLLHHHPDVDVRPVPNSVNALEFATIAGNTAIVQMLLDGGAHPDSALRLATAHGNATLVKQLLDHGADPCHADVGISMPGTTLASIGEKKGLPNALIKRLACPAVAVAH